MKKEKLIKFSFILVSIVISLVIFYFKDDIAKFQNYGLLGLFLISIIGNATIIIPAPVVVTAFIGGSIFNPYLAGIIIATGATIGELTGFLAGHGSTVIIKQSDNYLKITRWMKKSGFLTIVVLAAIPNPLFDLAGIISGMTKYPFSKFLLATLIGKTIKFVTIALLGSYLIL